MTAATVGIVSAPPVMNRNSATAAAPVKIFPVRKNPATAMKAHIATNKKDTDRFFNCVSIFFVFLNCFPFFREGHGNLASLVYFTGQIQSSSQETYTMFYNRKTETGTSDSLEWLLSTR